MNRRVLMLALALGGCAAAGPLEDREIGALERQLAERVAGEPDRCVPRIGATALRAVDRRTLVYDTPGTLWVNRLRGDCPGLRPNGTIVIETSGDSYCRGDRFRTIESGSSIPGPTCLLGDFTPHRRR
ncbi:MAG TPA: DUF6491 family protein [Allosphingosinicella sp.]|jgi:hypothetical protein